jgi:inosine-uridine nucleoside N-ribohydrolase
VPVIDLLARVPLSPSVTNVATAHKRNPTVFSRAKRVLWMGAALDVPGNTTPCAEFNLFADPYAGAYLFSLPPAEAVNIVVCPLDITTPHAVPFPVLMGDEGARPKSPLLDFVVAFLGRVRGIYESLGLGDAMEMHDPMCVLQYVSSSPPPLPPCIGCRLTLSLLVLSLQGRLVRDRSRRL